MKECKCNKDNSFFLEGNSSDLYYRVPDEDYKEIKLIYPINDEDDSHVALILSSVDRSDKHEILNKFLGKNVKIKISIEDAH